MSMRPFGDIISMDEARAAIAQHITPLQRRESVALADAHGRVLAADVVASQDVPPFDRASMDGYAVCSADTTAPGARLRLTGRAYTGDAPIAHGGRGTCIEIATGAPLPAGADAVVMVEATRIDGDRVEVQAMVRPRQNVGARGADIADGHTVLRKGEVINASRLGALAALGLAEVDVLARPRVAILSTGNEIAAQGRPLAPGHIYDINAFTLSALITEHGGLASRLRTARDTLADLHRAVDEALQHDLLVFSGGSSVGERDLILDVVRERGSVIFHGIAVKPGKPTLFGRIDHCPVFGLPGYPTSCLSNGYILLVPALRQMARLPSTAPRTVACTLAADVTSVPGRHQFYPVRLDGTAAVPVFKASGDITSMSLADGYMEIEADVTAVPRGTPVLVTLF
jgi:molybdenum cofactor synthesis domain-containing protein